MVESGIAIKVYNVYGLSEAAPRVSAQTEQCCKSNSVGQPIKGVQVCNVNEHGKLIMPGERGIIHIKTPCIFSGYITGQAKHASLFRDWFNTGDLGFFDNNRELHIIGRIDDIIIINSHKIYPNDIELAVKRNSSIVNCVVVGLKFQGRDILGCMYVGRRIEYSTIASALKQELLPYEIPSFYMNVPTLPTNQSGETLRRVVIETLQKELDEKII